MHPFYFLLALFAIAALVAFVFLIRWERRWFIQRNKAGTWLWVRLATVPIASLTTAMIVIPARKTPGMEALAVFYGLLFTAAPLLWFGAHWIVGKSRRPTLTFRESALIAGSPLLFAFVVAMIAHRLQPIAWSILRAMGQA